MFGFKARSPKTLAAKPYLYYFLATLEPVQVPEARDQHLINWQISSVDGEAAPREQHVIKQICPGAVATHYKHG
jgi:hypothetical protein